MRCRTTRTLGPGAEFGVSRERSTVGNVIGGVPCTGYAADYPDVCELGPRWRGTERRIRSYTCPYCDLGLKKDGYARLVRCGVPPVARDEAEPWQ